MMPGMSDEQSAVTGPVQIGTTGAPPTWSADTLADPAVWESLTDQTQTFSISLPRGWRNELGVVPTPTMRQPVARSTSPDGVTSFNIGDPGLPLFVDPAAAGFGISPGMTVRPATPAHQLIQEWAQFQFGNSPGFRIVSVAEFPPLVESFVNAARRNGTPPVWATGARLDAELSQDGRAVRAAVLMRAGSVVPSSWSAQVYAVTSAADAAPFVPALVRIIESFVLTAAENHRLDNQRMASAAQHQATMAQINVNTAAMTAAHQQNMAGIQYSGQAHQARMANMHDAQAMQMQSWQEQQQVSDGQQAAYLSGLRPHAADPALGGTAHEDYVNMIREERTVVDSAGDAHQVQSGYDRYYYRRHDQSWIALQQHENLADVPGIDPDDYEETRIQS